MALAKPLGMVGGLHRQLNSGDLILQSGLSIDLFMQPSITVNVGNTVQGQAKDFCRSFCSLGGTGDGAIKLPSSVDMYRQLILGDSAPDIQDGDGYNFTIMNFCSDSVTVLNSDDDTFASDIGSIGTNKVLTAFVLFQTIQPPVSVTARVEAGSAEIFLTTPLPIGNSKFAANIKSGAKVITDPTTGMHNTLVQNVIYGQGGITGVRLATGASVSGTFGFTFTSLMFCFAIGSQDAIAIT